VSRRPRYRSDRAEGLIVAAARGCVRGSRGAAQ